jgi:hypothetical protein
MVMVMLMDGHPWRSPFMLTGMYWGRIARPLRMSDGDLRE